MPVHPIDYRYGSEEMRRIFDEETKLGKMLLVEVELVKALHALGKIPKDDVKKIEKASKNVKIKRVKEIEKEIKHDVMAMVRALTELSGKSGRYVHMSATSYDIVDTALALQIKEAIKLLIKKGDDLLDTMLSLAEKYKNTIMIGRTHGQHAIPITLGFKFANYADKLGMDLSRLKYDSEEYVLGKFSGAVGNYASQAILGVEYKLEADIMKRLGLKCPI